MFEQRAENGKPARRGTLQGGRQEGEWTFSHPDGTRESQGTYLADVRTGAWTHWYPNGQRRMAGVYEQDRQEGVWEFWHDHGQLQCRGAYHRGREHGEWTFHHENGAVRQQGCYLDGKRELRWIARDASGSNKSEGCYLHDEPVGSWQTWDAAGEVTVAEYRLPEGCRIVRETWDDGSVKREGFLRGGAMDGLWVSRHRGGSVRMVGAFHLGKATGVFAAFRPDGSLFASGEVRDSKPVGQWRIAAATGEQRLALDRPQPPWDGEWSDAVIAERRQPDEVLARWLSELSSPVVAPLPPAPAVAVVAAPASAPPRLEAPTDPGEFTVREREELERYRRYYRDGWLPRQHGMGGEYGTPAGARRLGQGDRARADSLVGKRLPVTTFRTSDGQLLDVAKMRGKKVLLVVLRGFTTQVCVYCFAQTAELVPLSKRFQELNTEVVVVYPGSRSKLDAFLSVCKSEFSGGKAPYHMVYDPDLELSTALGVSGNLARPSALVLDQEGVIRAAYVAESERNIADRPPAKDLIALLEELSR